jgi:hypothetical protein
VVVVIVIAHEGKGVVEGEEERLEETDELGKVFVKLVFWWRIREFVHWVDYI